MEAAIQRAFMPGASPGSVVVPPVRTAEVPTSLFDPRDANLYFSNLLYSAVPSAGGIVGLLALPAGYFIQYQAEVNHAVLYLKCVAKHVDAVLEVWNAGSVGSSQFVGEIIQAVGSAAALTRNNRSSISSSGILPALAKLASGYRPLFSSFTADSNGLPPAKKQTITSASNGPVLTYKNTVLTPAHTEFLQCCLLSSHYHYASSFLSSHPVIITTRVTHNSTNSTSNNNPRASFSGKISPESYLRYYYYQALIYIGTHQYRNALASLSICVTMPSQIVSEITIAARKKMILVKCLLLEEEEEEEEGNKDDLNRMTRRMLAIPNSVSPCVARFFVSAGEVATVAPATTTTASPTSSAALIVPPADSASTNGGVNAAGPMDNNNIATKKRELERNYFGLPYYNELVVSLCSCNTSKVLTLKHHYSELLLIDGNMGLLNQLIENLLPTLAVRKLSRVYDVMPLRRLAEILELPDNAAAERVLVRIAEREMERRSNSFESPSLTMMSVEFRVDMEQGMVYFSSDSGDDDADCANSAQAELTERISACIALADRVRALDVSIATSNKYQALLMKEEGSKKEGGNAPRGVADLS